MIPVNGYWDGHRHDTLPFHGEPRSAIDKTTIARKKRMRSFKKLARGKLENLSDTR
jgi:hypothetical protein